MGEGRAGFAACGARPRLRNPWARNLPPGACILAIKHQSAWETLIFHALLPDPTFVIKRSLLWLPLVGWYLWKSGQIAIDRKAGTRALALMAKAGRAALAEGRQVIVFPEGHRQPPGATGTYHPGIAALYGDGAVPTIPVALNSGLFWRRNALTRHAGTIVMEFLPALPPGTRPPSRDRGIARAHRARHSRARGRRPGPPPRSRVRLSRPRPGMIRSRAIRLTSVYVMVTVLSAGFGVSQAPDTPFGILDGIVTGALIGIAIIVFERLVRDIWARKLRRFKPYMIASTRILYYLACFTLIPHFVAWLAHLIRPDIDAADLAVQHHVLTYFGFALLVNLLMAVRRMLGVRYLWAMTLGRYRRPTEEERIVAFMDLKGSTPLAERLGPARYHDFLNDVFFDVADAITESGGEVYQYVGDEIVVTWTARRGIKRADCVAFVFAVEDALAARRETFLADYGAEPRLRGALHIGPLMVGEIGDLKRQIVMIGDTMNTAARIEGACRKFGRDYIASVDLMRRVGELPTGVKAESLGLVPLAGKVSELELFALMRE